MMSFTVHDLSIYKKDNCLWYKYEIEKDEEIKKVDRPLRWENIEDVDLLRAIEVFVTRKEKS